MMDRKPLSYLNNAELADPSKADAVMDRLLLYDCYPGAASVAQMKLQRSLYKAYIPLYNALGSAGWCAIPYARVAPADAWCERYGDSQHGYFFAVRNPGPARLLKLSLDLKALGIRSAAFTAITGCKLESRTPSSVRLTIPKEWTAVVAVNRPEAEALAAAHSQEASSFHPSHP